MTAIDPQRLTRAMEQAGIPTAELARRIGMTTSYVARICKGERRLKRNPALRRRIADALDVPRDWIEIERPAPTNGEAA